MNCTGGRGTAGIPTCGTANGSAGFATGGATGTTAPTTPPATPGPNALPTRSVKFAGVTPVAGVPGVTNRTRNSAPWSTSPFVRPWQTVGPPTATTAEQVNVGLLIWLSVPTVVETKMKGLLPTMVPAGAMAVTLNVNELTLVVFPDGPTVGLIAALTVQVSPTSGAHGTPGVPAGTGVAAVAIAVSSAAAVVVAFGVAVFVRVAVAEGVSVAVPVGTSAVCVAAIAVWVAGRASAVCVAATAVAVAPAPVGVGDCVGLGVAVAVSVAVAVEVLVGVCAQLEPALSSTAAAVARSATATLAPQAEDQLVSCHRLNKLICNEPPRPHVGFPPRTLALSTRT